MHDGTHDLDLIRDTVGESTGEIIATESTSGALAALQEGAQALMVAVSSTDDPRIELARRIRDEALFTGCMLLLCRGRQIEDAFRLCRAEVFQDYVSIDPLYDAFRLRLAMHRALNGRRHDDSNPELATLGRDLGYVREATAGASADLSDGVGRLVGLIQEALTIALPVEPGVQDLQPPNGAGQAAIDEAVALRDRQARLLRDIELRLRSLESAARNARDPAADTILLVDDDPIMYEVLSSTIESLGFTLAWTMRATEAAARARSLRPKAILLDIVMPTMSGLDVLRDIRRDAEVGTVPVILLTGRQDVETVMAAKELGVDGYLVKPPKRQDLAAKLQALTRRG